MRLLFDVCHPVQVHVLRPVLAHFDARGDECRVVARDKDATLPLLQRCGIPAEVLAGVGRGLPGLARELVVREWRLLKLARRLRPRLIVGTSVHAARVARLCGARSVVFNDDDAAANPRFARLAYPLADAIVTPACLAYERHGPRQHTYAANQQLFYLHPARFTPDPGVRRELGLESRQPFGVVRLSARRAHHDHGVRGLDEGFVRRLAAQLAGRVALRVSAEDELPAALWPLACRLSPERFHHALAAAEFVVGDSQSVSAEAAVLGTPALRLNDFVGRLAYLAELEARGLAYGFLPGQEDALVERLEALLADRDRRAVFAARRARLLAESIDPLPWFVALLERLGNAA